MTSFFRHTILKTLAVVVALTVPLAATSVASAATSSQSTQFSVSAGSLAFNVAPAVPNFPAVTLNGTAQTTTATLPNWSVVDATGSGSGWNVTAQGDTSTGKSNVFKEYCNSASACGSVSANSYATSGQTLAASSLTLAGNATISALSGSAGSGPTQPAGSPYALDVATPGTKVLSAASGAGMGTWQAGSYGANGLSVSVPTTTKVLPYANEVYRLDLVWTLSTGP